MRTSEDHHTVIGSEIDTATYVLRYSIQIGLPIAETDLVVEMVNGRSRRIINLDTEVVNSNEVARLVRRKTVDIHVPELSRLKLCAVIFIQTIVLDVSPYVATSVFGKSIHGLCCKAPQHLMKTTVVVHGNTFAVAGKPCTSATIYKHLV